MSKQYIKFRSANVDGEFYDELREIGEILNLNPDDIYKDLIELTKQNMHCKHVTGLLTEYQNHSPERWETLYYCLNEDEIEVYGKLRQKYKISISKFAFIGFILFWDLLLYIYKERLKKNNFNVLFCSYRKIKEKFRKLVPIYLKRLGIPQKE